MAKIIELNTRAKQLDEMSLAELLEQCRDEKELAKVVCRRIKKLKQKKDKLINRCFWFAFPFVLVILCSLLYLIKSSSEISALFVCELLACLVLCGVACYSLFLKKQVSELSIIRREIKEAYKVVMFLWLVVDRAERSFEEFIEENVRQKGRKYKNSCLN